MNIRLGRPEDLDAVTGLEQACFPPAEAAGREAFASRLAAFSDHFWLLEADGVLAAMINGMATDLPLLEDRMFDDADMHDEQGDWQMIFGVDTRPEYQHRGLASMLMERVIVDARAQGRRGLVLTCKAGLIGFYERFGYVNEGVSASQHGGAEWFDMRLTF